MHWRSFDLREQQRCILQRRIPAVNLSALCIFCMSLPTILSNFLLRQLLSTLSWHAPVRHKRARAFEPANSLAKVACRVRNMLRACTIQQHLRASCAVDQWSEDFATKFTSLTICEMCKFTRNSLSALAACKLQEFRRHTLRHTWTASTLQLYWCGAISTANDLLKPRALALVFYLISFLVECVASWRSTRPRRLLYLSRLAAFCSTDDE